MNRRLAHVGRLNFLFSLSLSLSLSPTPYISRVGELDRFDIDLLGRRSFYSSVFNKYFPNRKKIK
jgi:hypothetical protein